MVRKKSVLLFFAFLSLIAFGQKKYVLVIHGGAGTITTDLMDDCGLKLAKLSDETLAHIAELFPAWNKPDHPLDLWIAIEQHGFEKVFRSARDLEPLFVFMDIRRYPVSG